MWIVDLSFVQAESQEGPRMSSVTQAKATLDDLHRVEGKAAILLTG